MRISSEQFKSRIWARGVIQKPGPLDNHTDCESDTILIHVATGQQKRFHGTWYDPEYPSQMLAWAESFPDRGELTAEQMKSAYELVLT